MTMTEPKPKQTDSETCTIRILFSVESDEQAIEYKHKIQEVLSDIPDANMQFALMNSRIRQ